jgi:hypothetical protein
MSFSPPRLDDRNFDDLVEEVLARIPAHTPEWTNPRLGDPGRTLVELFAWLTDTLLYRVNLIPERQRLVFLRMLGMAMRPAIPAHGIVALSIDNKEFTQPVSIRPRAVIDKPAHFETRSEMTVLPLVGEAYIKRKPSKPEQDEFDKVLPGLKTIYGIHSAATAYVTTPVFINGTAESEGLDLASRSIDRTLWIALLTSKEDPSTEYLEQVRKNIGDGRQIINIGLVPSRKIPDLSEEIGPRAGMQFSWEISYLKDAAKNQVDYVLLDLIPGTDNTAGLTKAGTMRLLLPSADFIGAPSNDVRVALNAGVGGAPPRLDDPKKAARLMAWIRLQPRQFVNSLSLSWVGINAIELDARQTIVGRLAGQSTGISDQEFHLPANSVEPASLQVQVEEPGLGYRMWQQIEDLALAGRDDSVYSLDPEAGTIRFGNGIRGRIPPAQARVRIAQMRAGGGSDGNLPPGMLTEIRALNLVTGTPTAKLNVLQSLAMEGGQDAETLEQAEARIPSVFHHKDRAVTAEDYRRLAQDTPGVRVGRVELMPRFKPQQRRPNVPGVVSVMVLPYQEGFQSPNPRADRYFLEAVHANLDMRRPLATELYTIGCEYKPLGVSTGITIQEGFGRQETLQAVQDALRQFLWPLFPGGIKNQGWPLGAAVVDRELEVIVARVPGVQSVSGVNLFEAGGGSNGQNQWVLITAPSARVPASLNLFSWQLPELLAVVVDPEGNVPQDLTVGANPFAGPDGVAVPAVPEVC